jgi:hypothetical protein
LSNCHCRNNGSPLAMFYLPCSSALLVVSRVP